MMDKSMGESRENHIFRNKEASFWNIYWIMPVLLQVHINYKHSDDW